MQTWITKETAPTSNGANEAAILESRSQFIAATLGIENIEVYEAGTGEDAGAKAKFAQPLEPGVAFCEVIEMEHRALRRFLQPACMGPVYRETFQGHLYLSVGQET